MLFSSISFLYYFLPIVLVAYFAVPYRWKNLVLLLSSLGFYFFGEPQYTIILIFSTIVDYSHSLVIEKKRGQPAAKAALISSIVLNLSILGFFKYADFFIGNINAVFSTDLPLLHLSLPLGISFFTFQTMSYTIDVYRNEASIQRNPLGLATYITLFPQLVAGPIVRYRTVANEINDRTHSFDLFAYGVRRFVIGLAKKVLMANQLGELYQITMQTDNPTVLFYWMGAIAFSLQIYFDFSGYSDMAIGLGRIFGFHFLENFNYPYISKSVSEFWRRWHISLGTWFKDYLYIPLGGNRGSTLNWFRNIFIVWFLTGFWHGANWNFIFWGLYFGILLILEKSILQRILNRLPKLVQHAYVILIVVLGFVIFNNEDLGLMVQTFQGMFGGLHLPFANSETIYYLRSYAAVILIAVIGATPLMSNLVHRGTKDRVAEKWINFFEPIFLIALLLIVTGYLVDSSFNPFLYFRF